MHCFKLIHEYKFLVGQHRCTRNYCHFTLTFWATTIDWIPISGHTLFAIWAVYPKHRLSHEDRNNLFAVVASEINDQSGHYAVKTCVVAGMLIAAFDASIFMICSHG